MIYKEIESLLKHNSEFLISLTFGHPFVDFRISHVGSTFEKLMKNEIPVIPSLNILYVAFMDQHSNQFENSLNQKAIFGRIARMWASFVREWHAYYMILEVSDNFSIDPKLIIRNDDLDTLKGIDIYLYNPKNEKDSIKLDILQSTKRAYFFRQKKDKYRIKDSDIEGIKYQIFLGEETIPKYTKKINNWYLLCDNAALRIVNYFKLELEKGLLFEVNITEKNRIDSQSLNTLKQTILAHNKTGLRATEIGFLGEIIVANYLGCIPHQNQTGNSIYNYDISYRGHMLEVKSMNRFVKPNENTDCCLNTYFSQKCDIYIFVGIKNNKQKAWIKGWIDRKGFEEKAKFIKAGSIRSEDNFEYKWDNWIIKVKDLFPINSLKNIDYKKT